MYISTYIYIHTYILHIYIYTYILHIYIYIIGYIKGCDTSVYFSL